MNSDKFCFLKKTTIPRLDWGIHMDVNVQKIVKRELDTNITISLCWDWAWLYFKYNVFTHRIVSFNYSGDSIFYIGLTIQSCWLWVSYKLSRVRFCIVPSRLSFQYIKKQLLFFSIIATFVQIPIDKVWNLPSKFLSNFDGYTIKTDEAHRDLLKCEGYSCSCFLNEEHMPQ